MRQLHVKQLTADRLQQAFPLLQSRDPGLSLDRWLSYAGALVPSPTGKDRPQDCGVMAVENEQGYIAALFTYRCDLDLRHGRLLTAENFVALDLLNPEACACALGEALENLALQLGCKAVRSLVPDCASSRGGAGTMAGVLTAQGHHDAGRLYIKEVGQPDGPSGAKAAGRHAKRRSGVS